MATTKFDIKTEALKPVMAGVGVTDLAVEVVRDAVADVQKRVAAVQKSATRTAADPRAVIEARVAELIERGESLVGRIRRQESTRSTVKNARTTVAKAKTTTTQAQKAADAGVNAADRTAAVKVAPQPKPTAKKATRRAAGKKAAATTARKTAAKKTGTAQSSAKATNTAATKTASSAVKAVADAAEKVGD